MKSERLIGVVFGRLTVLAIFFKYKCSYANCLCSCGRHKAIRTTSLNSGLTKSCGCIKNEMMIIQNTTHGQSKTKEYKHWMYMKIRCHNPNSKHYNDYGARQIYVCKKWLNSFKNFIKDMGLMPTKNHSVERINVNKGYSPSNCKWILNSEQARNKRNTIKVKYKGETRLICDWAKIFDMTERNLYKRYHKGMRGSALFFKGSYPNTHKTKK